MQGAAEKVAPFYIYIKKFHKAYSKRLIFFINFDIMNIVMGKLNKRLEKFTRAKGTI